MQRAARSMARRALALRLAAPAAGTDTRFSRILTASLLAHMTVATTYAAWQLARAAAPAERALTFECRELAYAERAPRFDAAEPHEHEQERERDVTPSAEPSDEPRLVEQEFPEPAEPPEVRSRAAGAPRLVTDELPRLPWEFASRAQARRQAARAERSARNEAPAAFDAPAAAPDDAATQPAAPASAARPDYATNPAPPYPRSARARGWEGTCVLSVRVRADGSVEDVKLVTSSGFDVLDAAALDAVRGWSFFAARVGGRACASIVEVPIVWRLAR